MIERDMIIKNKLGLHARAAAMLVETISKFTSDVILIRGPRQVDAKSIMGLMTLAAGEGCVITVRAEGVDEEEAVEALQDLIDRKFEEE